MGDTANHYIRKEVNFIYQKKQYNTFITPKTNFDMLVNTLKKLFRLDAPFVMKYRIFDNSFVTIENQEGLLNYIKQRFFAYTVYVQFEENQSDSSLEAEESAPNRYEAPKPSQDASTSTPRRYQENGRNHTSSSWYNPEANSTNGLNSHKGPAKGNRKPPQDVNGSRGSQSKKPQRSTVLNV